MSKYMEVKMVKNRPSHVQNLSVDILEERLEINIDWHIFLLSTVIYDTLNKSKNSPNMGF